MVKQPVHPAAQVAVVTGPEGELEVIAHEAESQDSHRDAKRCLGHDFDEGLIVVGLVEDGGPSVSTIEDMVSVSANRTASRTRHKPPGSVGNESEFKPPQIIHSVGAISNVPFSAC